MELANSSFAFNNKKQILIVYDADQTKHILGNILIKEGYDVVYAATPNEAADLFFNSRINFDLLILDLFSNGLLDIEFCKKIREKYNFNELPVLFVSKQINTQLIDALYSAGGSDYIAVPFNKKELLKKIHNLLAISEYYLKNTQLQNLINLKTQIFKMNVHDLKNPLSSIFSLSGIPVASFKDQEEVQQTLDVIHLSSKLMIELVNQVIEYLRVSTTEIVFNNETVDIVALVNQIIEINNPLAKNKKQKIHFNYPPEDCFIFADANKTFQAINNIVSNAIKFSEFHKEIWVDIFHKKEDKKIIITIKDEGPGFKKEELGRVFLENGRYSARPTGNEVSTGLGLLITKQIIVKSNGKINLESEEGKGSKFTIEYTAS